MQRELSIRLTYSIDLAIAFIIGFMLAWIMRPCKPNPPLQEAKKAPVSEREPHVVVDNRRAV